VENGLGSVQQVEYGTSVLQQARDVATAPWAHKLPNAMNVVVFQDTWNRLYATETTGPHETSELTYRDGYYDGVEKAFRGFGHVERIVTADGETDGQPGSRSTFDYDLGVTESQRFGLVLRTAQFEGGPGAWSPLVEERTTWDECDVAEVPTTGTVRVRWYCETRHERIVQEGAPESEWRTIRTDTEHDGYGQTTRRASLGVVHLGPPERPTACGVCAPGAGPCGAQCTGDEQTIDTTYISPGPATGGKWIADRASVRRTYGEAGGPASVEEMFYDGPDFVGAAQGTLTRGAVTRMRAQVDATTWIETQRVRHDALGNVVEEIGPNGSLDVADDERRRLTYDDLGIRIARVEDLFHDREGAPVALRREYLYEPFFYEVSESTAWMLVRGGSAVTARNSERYRYDAFGRVASILRPGDTDATPSEEYAYELANPVSRVVSHTRSQVGGPVDGETVACIDGFGREVQTRIRVAAGSYQVSGFQVLNRRGNPTRSHEPFMSPSGACDMAPPADVPFTTFSFDALDRPTSVSHPTETQFGSRSLSTIQYGPHRRTRFDAEDNETSSPHANTPSVDQYDGLGRLVSLRRDVGEGEIEVTSLDHDSLGRLVRVRAPDGVEHTQTFDLLGRVRTVADPDRGTIGFSYDPEGHILEQVDARGQRLATE
jgi:YD repeat-containing protein